MGSRVRRQVGGGSSLAALTSGGHGLMASVVARAITGSGGRASAESRGKSLVRQLGGEAPLKLKHFWSLDIWKPQICPLFCNLETQKKSDICVFFAKNHGWPRNGGGGWSKTAWGLVPAPAPA